MQISRAQPEHAAVLSEIAHAAKQHWNYPASWMAAWQQSALKITPAYVEAHLVYAAFSEGEAVGFYALELKSDRANLEHLWVSPRAMNAGVGRALFLHAERMAKAAGSSRMTIEADPHAEGFYLRQGAIVVGHAESKIGSEIRKLPLLEKQLG